MFLVVLCLAGSLHISFGSSYGKNYFTLYGNVIGEVDFKPLSNEEHWGLHEVIRHEINMETIAFQLINKMILYHTTDGRQPTTLVYSMNAKCYSTKLSIGHMYSIQLTTEVSHYMIITSDIYKRYHLYSHIFSANGYMKTPFTPAFTMAQTFLRAIILSCGGGTCYCQRTHRTKTIDSDWSSVSIATLNIWNINSTNEENWKGRIKRLGKVLMGSSLDLIGLQEVRTVVHDKYTVSQMQLLRKVLPNYQFVYQPAMLLESWPREEEGVALFSRYPIIFHNSLLLPWNRSDPGDFHQRVCLHCKVLTPVGPIDVLVTHLSLSEVAQRRSVIEIVDYMRLSGTNGLAILMGDFNTEPSSISVRYLNGEVAIDQMSISLPFIDSWSTASKNEMTGATFSTLDPELSKRIDYVFIQESFHSKLHIDSVFLINARGRPISDHLGVAVRLTT